MSPHSDDDRSSSLRSATIILLPILCCGLPLLIAGGALGGIGAVIGNPWVIGAAAALVVGVVATRVRRRGGGSARAADDSCCSPELPARDESRSSDQEF